jgi:hypothetical protein
MKKTSSQTPLISNLLPEAEEEAVREQLARVLASPSFRNSKRYPEFLRYTVEHALTGETGNIKERILGIEVFGRDPTYDTNLDPVVRMTAAEVRKRLGQYYQARGRENEIHIDFSRGSYVPEFSFPHDVAISTAAPAPVILSLKAETKTKHRYWVVWLAAASVVLGAGLWGAAASRRTVLDQFWSPVMNSQAPILLCIPDSISQAAGNRDDPSPVPSGALAQLPTGAQRDRVFFVDTFVVTKVAGALGKKGRSFRLFHTEDATLDDLKQGPAVLIGGTNNPWINRVSAGLRYSLADDGQVRYISDRQNPTSREWGINGNGWDPPSKVDYAVISRFFNSTTAQPIVIAAGARSMGTEAAGECLADPQCFEDAAKLAPGDWKHANIQIVVQAAVINEHPGQPHVLAAYLWQQH